MWLLRFFIGTISKGRTIRQTVLGGYFFGLAGTFTSFIILGNYGLGLQTHGILDLMGLYRESQDLYQTIIAIFEQCQWLNRADPSGGYYDRFLRYYF